MTSGSCLYPVDEVCYKPDIEPTSQPREASPQLLARAYAQQDSIFKSAFMCLDRAVAEHAFPGATVAVTYRSKLVALKAFGHFTFSPDSSSAEADSVFDLASVTKVVATTSMAMVLYERGLLDLDLPAASVVPEFLGEEPRRREVTLRMLLAHSSGLPTYEKLFLRAKNRAELLAEALVTPLTYDPGTKAEYSDIGFIILGVALERLADDSLDHFCAGEVFAPLGMVRTAFNPPASWRSSILPTADDQAFRHRIIQGEVQDENASVLGGVAGHAGLFSTAENLAIFANAMLAGNLIVRAETLALFTRRQDSPAGTSRALGWDTPSSPSQSGKHLSARSFGHLGYTGTSLWIDPERELSVILLTNRTWPDCSNQAIKQVRPRFHDAVVEALERGD